MGKPTGFLEYERETAKPVSYTHLDVYKRQIKAQPGKENV